MATGRLPINGTAAIQQTIVDAKGDLIAATGADAVSRLAVGANDTVLTADSSTATGLKWAAPAGGGMTEIASGTFNSSAVNITSIPSTYNNLQLVLRQLAPSTEGTQINIRFNNDSNSRYFSLTANSTNQVYSATYLNPTAGGSGDDTVREGLTIFDIWDYKNTSTRKLATWYQLAVNTTTTANAILNRYFGSYNQTGAITEINIFPDADNILGSYILYGVK